MAHRRTHLLWNAAFLLGSGLTTAGPIPPAGAGGATEDSPEFRSAAAFAGSQIWAGDNGASIARLGLKTYGLYRIRGARPEVIELPVPEGCCLSRAEMAATGDLIAYSHYRSDPAHPHTERFLSHVTVVDTLGHRVATIPGGRKFSWSRDGRYLAVLRGPSDPGPTPGGDRLAIWQRSDRTLRDQPHQPASMTWGPGDTLYLGYSGRVEALRVSRGTTTIEHLRWPDPSPDGQYSLRPLMLFVHQFELHEERTGDEVQPCLQRRLGEGYNAITGPYWVRLPGADHLLVVSALDNVYCKPGQDGCFTLVYDVRTLEIVQSFPGKVAGPTIDQRAMVVVRGDTLAVVPLGPFERVHRYPRRTVHVRIESGSTGFYVRALGPPPGFAASRVLEVGEGDWLPEEAMIQGGCGKYYRVTEVYGSDSLRVAFPPEALLIQGRDGKYREGASAVITRTPTRLMTRSQCGASITRLTVVR